jgi:hypothetical protein
MIELLHSYELLATSCETRIKVFLNRKPCPRNNGVTALGAVTILLD